MHIGVLGTGVVGQTISSRLVEIGHTVTMGSRSADNPKAAEWAASAGHQGFAGTFAEAARQGEMLFNCTAGMASLAALDAVDEGDLDGKVLIDVANALDGSGGFPPRLSVSNDDSLGEQIQRAHPSARVVKTLNTMNCQVMAHPRRLGGSHVVFLSGNDAEAKADVSRLLFEFGWEPNELIDLGDITTARGPEMYLALWVRMFGAIGSGDFNIGVVR